MKGEKMLQMQFALNDGSRPRLMVAGMVSKKFDAMTIQISKVVHYYIDMVPQFRYVYEEIDNNDFVQYARYMSLENIKRNYSWAGM